MWCGHGEEVFFAIVPAPGDVPRLIWNVKVLVEWRVRPCACVNYTCSASALPLLHRKETVRLFFDGRPRRLSNARENIFATWHGHPRGADPKMIGHQRSSTHGPALSPGRRKFSTSNEIWHDVPQRSHSAHPRQGNHTDARQTEAPSKLSLEKDFQTHPARTGKGVCVPLHSDKVSHDCRKVKILAVRPKKWPWGPATKPTVLGRPGSKLP